MDSKKDLGNGPPPPPDGGWGWVIVAASFLCNMVGVVQRKIILDNPCFTSGAGWDWLLIWDLCETTGGSLRGSWEGQNLISENLDQQKQHLLIFFSGWEHLGRFHHACGTNILCHGEQVWTPIDLHW